jgi:hypothetical protein
MITAERLEYGDLLQTRLCSVSPCNRFRFYLGEPGTKTLLFIGVNPSTADITTDDQTIRKIKGFSSNYGFDGWGIINLAPQRATDPDNMDVLENKEATRVNLEEIQHYTAQYGVSNVVFSWGNLIEKRDYLATMPAKFLQVLGNPKVYSLGELTQKGHPRHPLMVGYATQLYAFDTSKFLEPCS